MMATYNPLIRHLLVKLFSDQDQIKAVFKATDVILKDVVWDRPQNLIWHDVLKNAVEKGLGDKGKNSIVVKLLQKVSEYHPKVQALRDQIQKEKKGQTKLEKHLQKLLMDVNSFGAIDQFNGGREVISEKFWEQNKHLLNNTGIVTVVLSGSVDQLPENTAHRLLCEYVDKMDDANHAIFFERDAQTLNARVTDLVAQSVPDLENATRSYLERLASQGELSQYNGLVHLIRVDPELTTDIHSNILSTIRKEFKNHFKDQPILNMVFLIFPMSATEENKKLTERLRKSSESDESIHFYNFTKDVSQEEIFNWFKDHEAQQEAIEEFVAYFLEMEVDGREKAYYDVKKSTNMESMRKMQGAIYNFALTSEKEDDSRIASA